MNRAATLAIVVLLLSYGAVGARQPSVRTSVPLGVQVARLAETLGIANPDRSLIVLEAVRIAFGAPDGQDAADTAQRRLLRELFAGSSGYTRETVPLPLDPSVWRDTILRHQVPDNRLIPAILSDRTAALLYHGLAALDDETLAALGPDRETLDRLRQHAGAFATFGRSIRIHAGHVVVPGGPEAEPLWQELVGVEPARPGAFLRRLFAGDAGRLAYLFDALLHLDLPHQLFATGRHLPEASRLERMRALLDVFDQTATEWRPDDRPFVRPPFDPALTLSIVAVTPSGALVAPFGRRLWTRIFRGDAATSPPFVAVTPAEIEDDDDGTAVDAAWIASRVHRPPPAVGRRRLQTLLFAQRTLSEVVDDDAGVASAMRGFITFPALALTLERIGAASPVVMTRASLRAQALDQIRDENARRTAVALFQAALGILERIAQSKGMAGEDVARAVDSLVAVDTGEAGYGARIAAWLQNDLLDTLPPATADASRAVEDRLLLAMAGPAGSAAGGAVKVVPWRGQSYRVDPASAEWARLREARRRQGGPTLDAAIEPFREPADLASPAPLEQNDRIDPARVLAATLVSVLYAAHLREPGGAAPSGIDIAARHDLGLTPTASARPAGPWQLAIEEFDSGAGWRLTGSLLGLDSALARLAQRRSDGGPTSLGSVVSAAERQTAASSLALLNPYRMTDAARDEIAAALGRGRARLALLGSNRDDVEQVARAAGLSEWRREALAWTLTHDPGQTASALSLLELLWLGAPRPPLAAALDQWGTAMLPLTGCACLAMPRARAWEDLAGRPSQGVLATRAADVSLLVAEALAARRLPASLASGIVRLAMEDALKSAQPAYDDDWPAFTRTVAQLPAARIDDYITALTSHGPLILVPRAERRASH